MHFVKAKGILSSKKRNGSAVLSAEIEPVTDLEKYRSLFVLLGGFVFVLGIKLLVQRKI